MNRVAARSMMLFVGKRFLSLVEICVLCCAIATVVSWFAEAWWIADIVAQFRVQCAFGLAVGVIYLVWRRFWWQMAVLIPLLIWSSLPILFPPWQRVPTSTGKRQDEVRLLVFNVFASNRNYEGVVSYIEKMDPDIVGLLEIDSSWERELLPLEMKYPVVKKQVRQDNFGICFFSRLPVTSANLIRSDPDGIPSLDIQFDTEVDNLRLIITHPVPPVSRKASEFRNYQLEKLSSRLGELDGPCLLAGDLNLTPWSPHFRKLLKSGSLQNCVPGFGVTPTWKPYPTVFGGLAVDHILHRRPVEVRSRLVGPNLGSDHRPVIMDFVIGKAGG